LEKEGAATWGYTREEALKNIREVVEMIVEELIEDGKPFPYLEDGTFEIKLGEEGKGKDFG